MEGVGFVDAGYRLVCLVAGLVGWCGRLQSQFLNTLTYCTFM